MTSAPAALRTPVWIIALVATLFALEAASAIVIPLVLSTLIALTLTPAVRGLVALKIPRAIGATLVVAVALFLTGAVFYALVEPGQDWIERAPEALRRLEYRLRGLLEPFERASEATESLMSLGTDEQQTTVVAAQASPGVALLAQAPAVLGSVIATVFLTLLFMLHGDALFRKFVALVPGLSGKKEFVAGTREAQRELSLYLVTITAVNVTLGAATAAALYWVGYEEPLLWGGIAALLNYAPYVGAVVTAILLAVVGFAESGETWQVLAGPGAFVVLNLIEGQLVTPLLLGRRLALDPVVIFVGIMLFGFLWGVVGMLIAVPLLACLRIIAQRVANGGPIALLIGAGPRTDAEAGVPVQR